MVSVKVFSILRETGLMTVLCLGTVLSQTCNPNQYFYSLSNYNFVMPYFSDSQFPTTINTNIKLLIVAIHGNDRSGVNAFCNLRSAANNYTFYKPTTNIGSKTYVFAPMFFAKDDGDFDTSTSVGAVANATVNGSGSGSRMIYWDYNSGWKQADKTTRDYGDTERTPSYTAIDEMLSYLVTVFPNLVKIIVTGHSAGGQVAHRYALTSPIPKNSAFSSIAFKFLPANPSSYVYLTSERPALGTKQNCSYCNATWIMSSQTTFVFRTVPTAESCDGTFNEWKFGLTDRNSYAAASTTSTQRGWYYERYVAYLGSVLDVCNEFYTTSACRCDSSDIDDDCEANLQGACRLERMYYYLAHVKKQTTNPNLNHAIIPLSGISHSSISVYKHPAAQAALFDWVGTL